MYDPAECETFVVRCIPHAIVFQIMVRYENLQQFYTVLLYFFFLIALKIWGNLLSLM